METKLTHQIIDGKDDTFTLDEEYVAFKEDKCYPVYISEKKYTRGSFVGQLKVVFSSMGERLDISPPNFGFDGDFHLVKISHLLEWEKMIKAYKRFKKKNKK